MRMEALANRHLSETVIQLGRRQPNEPVQATAAAPFVFEGVGDSLLMGFVLAQSPAAVPDLLRSAAEASPVCQHQTSSLSA